jgi:ectoine hydroxylase-related dioxygenase (phytanoyl-CoA dioxygenase family)
MDLKQFKPASMLYNLFQYAQPKHNLPLYRRYGLKKFFFSPVSSKDFASLPVSTASIVSAEAIRACALYQQADEATKAALLAYPETGFVVLPQYLDNATVDAINASVDKLLREQKLKIGFQHKIMFAMHVSPVIQKAGEDPVLLELLNVLLGGPAVLFQSINFLYGSEQPTHSDSIHMTTYPAGGLMGVWIALEDIGPENGPLHYYPGSHLLPYYMNADYGNEGNWLFTGNRSYTAYEQMIQEKIRENGLRKQVFTAKKGDVLVWHANLFHGGEPQLNKSLTRKSMVFHYFRQNSICYHEISQRPALIRSPH